MNRENRRAWNKQNLSRSRRLEMRDNSYARLLVERERSLRLMRWIAQGKKIAGKA